VLLEGGYDLGALERASRALGRALLGEPFALPEGAVNARAQAAIDDTRRAHDAV
jgi:hypothetical protein